MSANYEFTHESLLRYLDGVRATWEAARATTHGWQPIETAPRDGTVIVVAVPQWHCWHCAAYIDGQWKIAVRRDGLMAIPAPDEWMPMPRHSTKRLIGN